MMIFLMLIAFVSIKPVYFTNTNYYYGLVGKENIIFGATNGGAVRFDYLNQSFQVLTNTDGLPTNRQNCLGVDSTGYVWAGCEFGLVQIDPNFTNVQVYPIEYLPSTMVRTIFCLKDTAFIGTTNGLLLIDTKGTPGDFNDDSRLGIYQENGLLSNNVITIYCDDTSVWVGTDNGVVRFTRDFSSYIQYTTTNGLLSNNINKINGVDTLIYVGTNLGLNQFTGDHFDTLLLNYTIKDIEPAGDSLLLALDSLNQVGLYFQGSLQIIKSGLPYLVKVNDVVVINNNWFCGLGNRWDKDYFGEGIGTYDFDNALWTIMKNNCLNSNRVTSITANDSGVFIAHGARANVSKGFSWLTNESKWINFTRDSILPTNHIHRCTTAPDGKIWFGVNAFPDNDSSVMVFSFNPTDSAWNFICNRYKGMEGAVAIWDLEFDNHNNLHLQLAGPSNRHWIIDSALANVYAIDPIQEGFYNEIALDSTGKIWRTISDDPGGLVMTDTKNTPFDRSDDNYRLFTTSDGLISNYDRGIIVDGDNNIYIATSDGLGIYNGTNFSSITGFSEQDLFDVELDSEGRVWIMARDGIYCYDPKLNTIDGRKFTEMNVMVDFLPQSKEVIQIQGFKFDPIRKCFWLGGETGLLKLEIQYDTLAPLDSIVIYPNPVIGTNILMIKNVPTDAEVNIYSIAGRLIAENLLPREVFNEVRWEIPGNISSGLYFALIKSSLGNKVCKFAIVK